MDLYTFRHLAADLLVYQDIRLPSSGLCGFEDLLRVPSKVGDDTVIGAGKINSVLTPHRRNVVSTLQSITPMRHDAVKLILQRHVAVSAADPCSILRQVQSMVGYHRISHLGTTSVIVRPHADHLDHQDLRTSSDDSVPGAPPAHIAALSRTTGDLHGFGPEILCDKVCQVAIVQSGWRHWKLQAICDIAAGVDFAAVLTGPLPLERHSEQTIGGYVSDEFTLDTFSSGVHCPVKKSAFCRHYVSLHHYRGRATHSMRSISCGSLRYSSMLVKPVKNSWGSCCWPAVRNE